MSRGFTLSIYLRGRTRSLLLPPLGKPEGGRPPPCQAGAAVDIRAQAHRAGKRIVGYGAPAKANTLLNYCGIGPELLEFGDRGFAGEDAADVGGGAFVIGFATRSFAALAFVGSPTVPVRE